MKRFFSVLAVVVLLSCQEESGGSDGGKKDGGSAGDAGSLATRYRGFVLDGTKSEPQYLAMAVDAVNDRVGVAYFVSVGLPPDGGPVPDHELRYVEWKNDQVSAPEVLRRVQRLVGLSLAFQASGEPAVAYLGGGSDMSAFWFQSDAVVSYRSAGVWTERVAITMGADAPCGNPVSDRGFLVGLWPALVFDGAKAYLAWRDGHDGQFPMQDWGASDLKMSEGGPTSWTQRCLQTTGPDGGVGKQAYGARTHMVMANGQPALVHSQALGGADTASSNVIFMRRNSNGTWTAPLDVLTMADVQTGASLAWDSQEGYAIAAVDKATDALLYTSSKNGTNFNTPDPVFNLGSGGWYPSLAFNAKYHEPAIAFYVCSARSAVPESACPASDDELRVGQRINTDWQFDRVYDGAVRHPKLGFLSDSRRVVAFREAATGVVQLAVEKGAP